MRNLNKPNGGSSIEKTVRVPRDKPRFTRNRGRNLKPYYEEPGIVIYHGDCREILPDLPKVDLVLTDPPYGITELHFDKSMVDLNVFWDGMSLILKKNGIAAIFSAQPFTTDLINSNRAWFRYDVVWCKTMGTRFYDANKMPLRAHENICIFTLPFHGNGNHKTSTYNPQFQVGVPYKKFRWNEKRGNRAAHYNSTSDPFKPTINESGDRYPFDWIVVSNGNNNSLHPTQKPLELIHWLVATYSNDSDLVLDPFMGSGTTLRAAKDLGRKAIGIEIEEKYCEISVKRLSQGVLSYEA